jgi:hypothetical protein
MAGPTTVSGLRFYRPPSRGAASSKWRDGMGGRAAIPAVSRYQLNRPMHRDSSGRHTLSVSVRSTTGVVLRARRAIYLVECSHKSNHDLTTTGNPGNVG